MLLAFAATLLATCIAAAQAPPSSFFAGRSNAELRALAADREYDVLVRRGAATKLVMNLADAGEIDAAEAAAQEFAKNIDPFAIRHVRAVRRRGYVHLAGLAWLAIALGAAIRSLVAERRSLPIAVRAVRRVAPIVLVFLLYCGLAGGWLASLYENGSPLPFVVFAAAMVPLVAIVRMWSAIGSQRRVARIGRSVVAVLAAIAVGFLVVERVNPAYLEGFGL